MVEPEGKKSSLKLIETYVDPGDITEELRNDIKRHFPVYFNDDINEIAEEVNFEYSFISLKITPSASTYHKNCSK